MVELYSCLDMFDRKDEVLKDKVILKISSHECLLDQMQEPERGLVVALVEGKGWNILSGRTCIVYLAWVKIF